jgi:hypothetical protein
MGLQFNFETPYISFAYASSSLSVEHFYENVVTVLKYSTNPPSPGHTRLLVPSRCPDQPVDNNCSKFY